MVDRRRARDAAGAICHGAAGERGSPGVGGLRIYLPSGASTSVIYHVPQAGPLQMLCHLPGHLEKGMAADVVLVTPLSGPQRSQRSRYSLRLPSRDSHRRTPG